MDSRPIVECVLRYETASTLLLRNVLDHGNPRHAAILDEFCSGVPPSRPPPGGPLAGPDVKPSVKRRRALAAAALAGAAPGEDLVCDLTDDAVGPKWASKKRSRQADESD